MTAARARALALPTLAAVVIAVVALLVRSGDGAPARGAAAAAAAGVHSGTVTVQISHYMYSPDQVTVTPGTRIVFTNHDPTAHTATLADGTTGTGAIEPHSSRTLVLSRPGVYHYHCVFHAFMTGTITVVAR